MFFKEIADSRTVARNTENELRESLEKMMPETKEVLKCAHSRTRAHTHKQWTYVKKNPT